MRFDLKHHRHKPVVMHCATKEDALIFLDFLDSAGMRWCNGRSYIEFTPWRGADECYNFNEGRHGSLEFYTQNGCTILEYDDFEWDFNNTSEIISYDDLMRHT
jgi:hypothetical protein